MTDAKSAIRWIRQHANELGIDINRVAVSGGSAGGQIALSSAVFDDFDEPDEDRSISSKPNALVLFNPTVDTTRTENLKSLFGERAREASPLHHIAPGFPPTVIFHGRADTLVPYATVEEFCRESTRVRNQCQLFGYEGATHGFSNLSREEGKWYRETLLETDRFLTELGYLPEPSPAAIR